MNLQELKEQNPGLYETCVNEGIQKERERCLSLLPEHVASAMSKYAIKCIKDGSPFGDLQKTNYMALQLEANRKHQFNEKVVSLVEKRLGIDNEDYNS